MGLGDAKFMTGMGLLLGLEKGITAVFLSFWIGAGFVLILYLHYKIFYKSYNISMKSELPFAPFLVVGTLVQVFSDINLINLGN
jgi:prepilin signal peptidase PulO-like enzyme (type II secretory pathway)